MQLIHCHLDLDGNLPTSRKYIKIRLAMDGFSPTGYLQPSQNQNFGALVNPKIAAVNGGPFPQRWYENALDVFTHFHIEDSQTLRVAIHILAD